MEMYESGELAELLGVEQPPRTQPSAERAAARAAGPIGLENRLD